MRSVFIIIFLSACIHSFSQKVEFDIGKASVYCEAYPAKEKYGGRILQGTGFIVEHRHRFYFITNYHNIVNHYFYTKSTEIAEEHFQKIRLILKRKSDNEWGSMFINLFKDNGTNNFYRTNYNGTDADVIAIPVDDTSGFLIEPVAIPKINRLQKDDIVFIVGFPDVAGEKHFQLVQFGKVIPNPNIDSFYARFADYPVEFLNRRTSAGFSGSPVYLWPNTKKPPVLAGINAAVDIKNEVNIFWRVEVLQNLLTSIPLK